MVGITRKNRQRAQGFTVAEIIIVIVVIGILASIALVAYPGYQKQTRDNERKNDLAQLSTALHAYAVQKNNYMGVGSNCGLLGNGSGWIGLGDANGGGLYPNSILKCLKDAGVINNESDFIDPSGCLANTGGACTIPTTAYMKVSCSKNNVPITYLLAHLETEPLKGNEINALCQAGSLNSGNLTWGTDYGMNYYVVVR